MTPMMEQYFEIKNQYKDFLLFYRVGDFYEMFFDDAKAASAAIDLTLTGKDWGEPERAPMCGVPFHAADTYIAKLIAKGYKKEKIEAAIDELMQNGIIDFSEAERRLLEKKLPEGADENEKKQLLYKSGFHVC